MASKHHIVKRAGHAEPYDARKLYASIYYACVSTHESGSVAELLAETVTKEFEQWLTNKPEITSGEIRRVASQMLDAHNHDAAFLYKHHRNFS